MVFHPTRNGEACLPRAFKPLPLVKAQEDRHPSVLSSNDGGWIVGENGTILHWDGNSWTIVESPTDVLLMSACMCSSSEGRIVTYNGEILRWDGNVWRIEKASDEEPIAIF